MKEGSIEVEVDGAINHAGVTWKEKVPACFSLSDTQVTESVVVEMAKEMYGKERTTKMFYGGEYL